MTAAYLPPYAVPTMTNHDLEFPPEKETRRCEEVGGGADRRRGGEDRPNGDGSLTRTESIK